MPVLEFPSIIRSSREIPHLLWNTSSFTAPFTRQVQTQELPGAVWTLQKTLPPLNMRQQRVLRAWVASMRGQAGRVHVALDRRLCGSSAARLRNPFITADLDTITADSTLITTDQSGGDFVSFGSPIVVSGSGRTIESEGWTADRGSYTGLMVGDYFSVQLDPVGRSLHVITESDVLVSNDGTATLTFEPPLRGSALAGSPINFRNPTCVMRLVGDDQGALEYQPGRIASTTLSFVESFT